MSELKRVEVLNEVQSGRRTVAAAASVLVEVRWRGHVLPYRVFSKDQRVSHTAIVENKRLGHSLAIVKAQQDLRIATKVMTNSEKTGYKKRGRSVYGTLVTENGASAF